MITVENLAKKYGRKYAVKGLSFTVPDASVTGFLGPNGSGKSTTMRCILGLDTPTQGKTHFDGVPFRKISNKPAVAGSLLDASWFTPNRSGKEHLKVLARGAGIPFNRVDECLEIVGLGNAASKKAGGYSLGMKQRLGLAAALLGDPKHIILDEPVNGLDPEGVSWMRRTIRSLAEEGRSVLVSSHLLSEMEQTADRLVVIGKGSLIGEYSMEDFLAGGSYVVVSSQNNDLLNQVIQKQGLRTEKEQESLKILLPRNYTEQDIRSMVGELSVTNSVPLTELRTVKSSLEERFLMATSQAQEYKTMDFVQQAGATENGSSPQAQQAETKTMPDSGKGA